MFLRLRHCGDLADVTLWELSCDVEGFLYIKTLLQ
jgi:hypothetical protein